MKEAYLPKQETLLTEIRNWKNTENLCKGVYDDETLKSRSFLRMKMQTYRRLYRKYEGPGLSVDEEALHRMLRYHYKKIEKELYPRLLMRIGMRAWTAVAVQLVGGVKNEPAQEMFNAVMSASGCPSEGVGETVTAVTAREKAQAVEQERLPEGWWVNDLRQKKHDRGKDQQLGLH